MNRTRVLIIALALAASGLQGACSKDDAIKVATSVVNAVSGLPKVASTIKKTALKFWKGVTTAATRVSTALAAAPTRIATAAKKKVHPSIKAALQNAIKLAAKGDGTCAGYDLAADGDAYCAEDENRSYVVFCDGGEAYALECAVFSATASCGEVDDLIDCGTTPSTKIASVLTDATPSAADSGESCAAESESAADCEDGYVVYCSGGKVLELDCGTYESNGENATCGVLSGAVTCGFDQ